MGARCYDSGSKRLSVEKMKEKMREQRAGRAAGENKNGVPTSRTAARMSFGRALVTGGETTRSEAGEG